jgi:hypothetical protein
MGCIRRVAAAGKSIKPYIAADFAPETTFESGRRYYRHVFQAVNWGASSENPISRSSMLMTRMDWISRIAAKN